MNPEIIGSLTALESSRSVVGTLAQSMGLRARTRAKANADSDSLQAQHRVKNSKNAPTTMTHKQDKNITDITYTQHHGSELRSRLQTHAYPRQSPTTPCENTKAPGGIAPEFCCRVLPADITHQHFTHNQHAARTFTAVFSTSVVVSVCVRFRLQDTQCCTDRTFHLWLKEKNRFTW